MFEYVLPLGLGLELIIIISTSWQRFFIVPHSNLYFFKNEYPSLDSLFILKIDCLILFKYFLSRKSKRGTIKPTRRCGSLLLLVPKEPKPLVRWNEKMEQWERLKYYICTQTLRFSIAVYTKLIKRETMGFILLCTSRSKMHKMYL